MTLALVKPAGWDEEDPLTSDEMNELQGELVKAVDGVNGGTYEIDSDLVFDGAGKVRIANELRLQAGATFNIEGAVEVKDDSIVNVRDGAAVNVEGSNTLVTIKDDANVVLQDGGSLLVQTNGDISCSTGVISVGASGTFRIHGGAGVVRAGGALALGEPGSAGALNVTADGTINLASSAKIIGASGSEITLNTLSILKLANVAFSGVHSLAALQHVPGQWDPWSGGAGFWLDNAADGAALIAFAMPLTPGDTLTTVIVNLRGQAGVSGHAAVPATRPRASLLEIASDGTLTTIDAQNDPTTGGDVSGYNAAHAITLSAGLLPRTVGSRLVLTVRSEGGAGAETGKTLLLGIGFVGIARAYRASSLLI